MLTPKQIKAYKDRTANKHPNCAVLFTAAEINGLLTALQEAEQQAERSEHERDELLNE